MSKDLWRVHAVLGVIIVALGALTFVMWQAVKTVDDLAADRVTYMVATNAQLERAQTRTKSLEALVASLEQKLSGNQKLFDQYVKTSGEQDAIARAKASLAELNAQVSLANVQNALTNTTALWSKRVANVTCDFGNFTQGGSGTLFTDTDGTPIVITNKHVITSSTGKSARACTVVFPELEVTYTVGAGEGLRVLSSADVGVLVPSGVSAAAKAVAPPTSSFCKSQLPSGTRIVVMGYPTVGAADSVTVTEGIISGYENKYYTTSAKVEHGNSGGAVIAVDSKCYVGIPTFVESGELESLARVLDIRTTGLAP